MQEVLGGGDQVMIGKKEEVADGGDEVMIEEKEEVEIRCGSGEDKRRYERQRKLEYRLRAKILQYPRRKPIPIDCVPSDFKFLRTNCQSRNGKIPLYLIPTGIKYCLQFRRRDQEFHIHKIQDLEGSPHNLYRIQDRDRLVSKTCSTPQPSKFSCGFFRFLDSYCEASCQVKIQDS
ncbi:hypothetical protein DMENIID0001_144730 [Sergentomyia squamirostris]